MEKLQGKGTEPIKGLPVPRQLTDSASTDGRQAIGAEGVSWVTVRNITGRFRSSGPQSCGTSDAVAKMLQYLDNNVDRASVCGVEAYQFYSVYYSK